MAFVPLLSDEISGSVEVLTIVLSHISDYGFIQDIRSEMALVLQTFIFHFFCIHRGWELKLNLLSFDEAWEFKWILITRKSIKTKSGYLLSHFKKKRSLGWVRRPRWVKALLYNSMGCTSLTLKLKFGVFEDYKCHRLAQVIYNQWLCWFSLDWRLQTLNLEAALSLVGVGAIFIRHASVDLLTHHRSRMQVESLVLVAGKTPWLKLVSVSQRSSTVAVWVDRCESRSINIHWVLL